MLALQDEKRNNFQCVNEIFVRVMKYGRVGARMKQLTKTIK